MLHIFNGYETIIFDCDGVILDSNNLKIEAMYNSLQMAGVSDLNSQMCCQYFKNNFGKSRFDHVKHFVEKIISSKSNKLYECILNHYSSQCEELYLKAEITPGFFEAISNCHAKLFIASGSLQEELRDVFKKRNLDNYFSLILGSPETKANNVATILSQSTGKALMVGDALSDFYAAKENGIDFIAYLPFSNVKEDLENLSISEGFSVLRSW
ncbi:HAD family hydrolase [Aeromonas hydrophila]|uniref:HAD family hydrolase n=1 Tax=Aeromonas TaxID=642 RepID=UPI001B3A59C2|nr:HAD hydrolase-like protein [Aeromonas hydrophila]MBQ4677645.1 HAD hydrolase-like protein [Aeromonas hydrophila]MBW3816249.1 HAD hydrolase-like protein [Aeromonas hydrophila]MCF7676592.1 HAD family hydrolase [Aeromonas hydrophila]MCF7773328.1 HAD family hydrolase [Aeromonas hydrophila]